jgi:hypothetical protein
VLRKKLNAKCPISVERWSPVISFGFQLFLQDFKQTKSKSNMFSSGDILIQKERKNTQIDNTLLWFTGDINLNYLAGCKLGNSMLEWRPGYG